MDKRALAGTRDTVQEVATAEWNPTVRIPFLRLEEVLSVAKQHLLDAGVKDDRRYGSLVPRISPAPTAMRVSEIDLYPVNRLSLMLLLGLKDELFQNRVVACNDTKIK